ncbi:hypothetical protein B0T20DRAFT_390008 [Sordaria brevicollis]|uniref:Uncharacterized protein n=1 Tax=Sordaria brevicollis TaxID=83679 RepID=A0AAE0PLI8_SORBR|nr:hypothetical protein B0T20DRAFT_390008 [Sordaria brevicollis]
MCGRPGAIVVEIVQWGGIRDGMKASNEGRTLLMIAIVKRLAAFNSPRDGNKMRDWVKIPSRAYPNPKAFYDWGKQHNDEGTWLRECQGRAGRDWCKKGWKRENCPEASWRAKESEWPPKDEILRMERKSRARVSFLQFFETGRARVSRQERKVPKLKGANARPSRRRGGRQWLGSQPNPWPPANRLAFQPLHPRIPMEQRHQLVDLPGHPAVGKHVAMNGGTE